MIKTVSMAQYISMKARGWDVKVLSGNDSEATIVLTSKKLKNF